MTTQSSLGASIGSSDGDYIKLENQWARVTITREDNGNGMPEFVCTGDLLDFRQPRIVCLSMREAMNYALESLALYQRGRAS